jgi:iron complex transport system permease protein
MTVTPDTGHAAAWHRLARRRRAVLLVVAGLIAVSVVVDVATGPAFLSPSTVARSILRLAEDRTVDTIVWSIRLPVALMALAVGAALGLTGAVMQTILANPLASGYTLGVASGAGFGASLVIVFGAFLPIGEAEAIPLFAFVFASLASAAVWGLGRARGATPEGLVLAGVALLFLFQALTSLLQFVATPEALSQIVFWLFGSLTKATWGRLAVVVVLIGVTLPVLGRDAWRLTALKLGDEKAAALGVDVAALRMRSLAVVSVLTAAAVAFVGTIGFVGIVAPHVARMTIGEDQRFFLPAAALNGALLLSLASIASKTVVPGAIFPIGIVTALIGVPFFLFLVMRTRRAFW